jgi:hypothetical protein
VTYAFALTIPGLAVGLVLLGLADLVLFRRTGRRLLRGSRHGRVAPTAYDEATAFFAPGKRFELEERQTASVVVDGTEQRAPGTTTVDLAGGTARVTRPARTDS